MKDTTRGLYRKYDVERIADPIGKHRDCEYFVLDLDHDPCAREALAAYIKACRPKYPTLAGDLERILKRMPDGSAKCGTCGRLSRPGNRVQGYPATSGTVQLCQTCIAICTDDESEPVTGPAQLAARSLGPEGRAIFKERTGL